MDMETTVLEIPTTPSASVATPTDALIPPPVSISSMAAHKSAQACFDHAEILWNGSKDWPVNRGEAALWYEQAAEKGLPAAMYEFAECLRWGDGVLRNPKRAEVLYRMAAEAGDMRAIHWLAHAYTVGDGVPRNLTEAAKWQQKAGTQFDFGATWVWVLVGFGALVSSIGYWWFYR